MAGVGVQGGPRGNSDLRPRGAEAGREGWGGPSTPGRGSGVGRGLERSKRHTAVCIARVQLHTPALGVPGSPSPTLTFLFLAGRRAVEATTTEPRVPPSLLLSQPQLSCFVPTEVHLDGDTFKRHPGGGVVPVTGIGHGISGGRMACWGRGW